MIRRTIKYTTPFTKEEVTEDYYFNLTEFEVVEINLMEDLISVGKSKNPKRVIPTFKRIVRAAVGQRVGDDFIKTEEFANAFMASEAYSKLFVEILGGDDSEMKMTTFINGIIPENLDLSQPVLPSEPEAVSA